jgi:DNA-binding NarL/FixJ family response regulator
LVELILIVAKPGRLREALCTLLKAASRLEPIEQVDDSPSALKIVNECDPGLVLLDAHLPDNEISALLGQIKAKRPQTRCIVLANTVEQQQAAKRAGADEVLLKGFSTANLLEAIDKLMLRQEI